MKKIVVFLLLIVVVGCSLLAQENTIWDYPVKPGTKEWAKFETNEQMIVVCQIPSNLISEISTEELIKICLNYPLLNNYMAFNDERVGIDVTIRQFNGLQELIRRKDCTQALMKAYSNYPILSHVQNDINSDSYHVPYKLPFIELLLSNDMFIEQLSNEELKELLQIVTNKYATKLQNPNVYSLFNVKKTMLLAAVVMSRQNKKEKHDIIAKFITDYNNLAPSILTEMSKLIKE